MFESSIQMCIAELKDYKIEKVQLKSSRAHVDEKVYEKMFKVNKDGFFEAHKFSKISDYYIYISASLRNDI